MAPSLISELAQKTVRETQPQAKKQNPKFKDLNIGLPKEISVTENRICLCPNSVAILVKNGHTVTIEKDAGLRANFKDADYIKAGAKVVNGPKEVYASELILKINPVQNSEFQYLTEEQTIISTLNLPKSNKEYFEVLNQKKVNALAFEYIEDKGGEFPIVRAMSEIAGSTSVLLAAEYLSNSTSGKGIILGGITGVKPAKIVILGAGTVAEYAIKAALGLGAQIKVFDTQNYRLRRIKYAIGQNLFTSIIDHDSLSEAVAQADVVIGCLKGENELAPMVVTEEMISSMEEGSIVIDVAIDQGGCIETSEHTNFQQPICIKNGIIHCGISNLASKVAKTSSLALSHIFTPILVKTGMVGGIEEMVFTHKWFMKGTYTYKGHLTKLTIARKYSMRFKDLSLLLAAKI